MSPSDLSRYPRPSLAVDVAVLTVVPSEDHGPPTQLPGRLAVLVQLRVERPVGAVLPGRFVRERQTLAEAVHDAVETKAGIKTDREPILLRIFDSPDRDERGWVVSAAHAVTLPYAEVAGAVGDLLPVGPDGELLTSQRLLFDHTEMLREAVAAIRARYELAPDPDGLLVDDFTLAELRAVHEAVLGESLLRDTFNRRMLEQLEEVTVKGESLTRPSGGRPARIYRRRAAGDLTESERRRLRLPRAEG